MNSYSHSNKPVVQRSVESREYTAQAFETACRRLGVLQSMGRVGSALDNAAAEVFNSTIKVEYIHRHHFRTRARPQLQCFSGYLACVVSRLGPGASGAIRRFAGWVARGSVGHPMLEGIDYWDELKDSPSQMETCFAIFANVLELDEQGMPTNEKYAERRAATWLYRYCTGGLPPGEPDLEPWECELY